MKTLFLTSTRIGDAVLTTGLLDYLIKEVPDNEITLACGPLPAPLFADMPRCKKLITIQHKSYSRHWFDLWKTNALIGWDITVDLRGSLMTYFLNTQNRFIWTSRKTNDHRVEQLAGLMKLDTVPMPKLWISEQRGYKVGQLLPKDVPMIAIAPAANWIGKEWPVEHFIELTQKMIAQSGIAPDAKILVFAAPQERERVQPFINAFPKDRLINFVGGDLDLLDIAAVFKQCDLFVGNDSGLMHIAAAVKTPTLGLFGPSRDEHYAPYGLRTSYIRTPESYEELWQLKETKPNQSLMRNLFVEDVYNACEKLWKRYNTSDVLVRA